jgi:protein phosphatase
MVLAVADGMGGMGDGDVASSVAIREAFQYLLNAMTWQALPVSDPADRGTLPSFPGLREQLTDAVTGSDAAVRREGKRPGVSGAMGTTLTFAYVRWPVLYVTHVGDSRCCLSRGDALLHLTTDHTVAEDMKDRGASPDEVPARFAHLLWNAIGGGPDRPRPQIRKMLLQPGDCMLLCSDGLTKHVGDEEIAKAMRTAPTAREGCAELVALANARGGTDNVTVVLARADSQEVAGPAGV